MSANFSIMWSEVFEVKTDEKCKFQCPGTAYLWQHVRERRDALPQKYAQW